MDHTDTLGSGYSYTHSVLPPTMCEVCAASGTTFLASTTPGPGATLRPLPYLRCPDCKCFYQYNGSTRCWDAVLLDLLPGMAFVPLADLDPDMAQWD